jgi:subtilisin family serine protease
MRLDVWSRRTARVARTHPRRRLGISLWLAGLATLAVVGLAGPAASADRESVAQDTSASAAGTSLALSGLGGERYRITLITGDVVELTAASKGQYTATFDPAARPDGSKPSFAINAFDGDLYVFPEDAHRLVSSGRLDKELFNVAYLAANGYADTARGTVPVIAEYPERLSAAAEQQRAEALPASNVSRALESIDAAALTVSKSHAESFWASLRPDVATKTAQLDGDVTKLWLDRKVEAALDQSVPQIGAPEAWAAGFDGAGVKVAVLDTGIDENHPDVAGKVVASRSFIPTQAVADGHGHGTHVAATVAGTGAAEVGTRKGVAPGAQLVIGKVLSNGGSGPISGVIEGMEWAAVEQDVDVVNMSLGSPPTDGTDPGSHAVNSLTRDTGTLFVISAGNGGRSGSFTVGTPGAADAALTVAAVNKADQLADFSSRGPRFGDSALKPDIAAPGVGIVAARAAGTSMGTPVDERYTSANGTSMAAPHVAGAAAILAQRYPDWTAEQLKPALMSTTRDAGYGVYEQGAGRVDVARAVTQEVFATTANIDFKTIAFDDEAPRTGTVAYTNLSDQPVTLGLATHLRATQGPSVPEGTLVAPDSVTVPAGGTTSVEVTLNAGPLESNTYTGAILATSPDGTRLTTPVGFAVGEQLFELTVTHVKRQKDAAPWKPRKAVNTACPVVHDYWAQVDIVGIDGPGLGRSEHGYICWKEPAPREQSMTFHVPKGTYYAQVLSTWNSDSQNHQATLINPEFEVTGDTQIVLDADAAKQITIETPEPSELHAAVAQVTRITPTGRHFGFSATPGWGEGPMTWATPTGSVKKGSFVFSPNFLLAAPRVTATIVKPLRMTLHPVPSINIRSSRDEFTPHGEYRNLPIVYAGQGTAEEFANIDARGKLVLMRVEKLPDPGNWFNPRILRAQLERAFDAGAVGVLYHPEEGLLRDEVFGVRSEDAAPTKPIPYAILPAAEADRLIELIGRGPVRVSVAGIFRPETPYVYSIKVYEEGRVSSDLHYEFERDDLARIDAAIHTAFPGLNNLGTPIRRPHEFVTFPVSIGLESPRTVPVYVGPIYKDAAYEVGLDVIQGPPWVELGFYGFDKPARVEARLGLPPLVPGVPHLPPVYAKNVDEPLTLCSGCRQRDVFYPQILAVSAWRHAVISPFAAGSAEGEVHLSRDGVELPPRSGFFGLPVYDLPSAPARYKLEIDEQGSSTAWEFTSSTVSEDQTPAGYPCWDRFFNDSTEPCRAEPLVFVNYTPELGLDNLALAGRKGEIRVSAYHHEPGGPKIAGLKLWVSTDDGADWDQVKVKSRGKGVFEADVRYPKLGLTTGAVSLKAEAWDVAGNRVEQTVNRAFGLREGSGGGDDDDDDDDDD